jgi:hypothetical protein
MSNGSAGRNAHGVAGRSTVASHRQVALMRILSAGPSTLPLAEGPVGSVTDASTHGVAPMLGAPRLDIGPGWFHLARPGVAERLIRPRLDDAAPLRAAGLDIDRGFYLPVPPWEMAVYRVTVEGRTQVGLILEVAIADYLAGRIRAHEVTCAPDVDALADHLVRSRVDLGPVTLAHRHDLEVSLALAEVTGLPAGLAEMSRDGAVHEVWLVEADRLAPVLDRLARTGSLDVVDGHHRCAAAARLARPDRSRPDRERAQDRIFAFVVDQDLLQLASHHLRVRGADPSPVRPEVPTGLFLRERGACSA